MLRINKTCKFLIFFCAFFLNGVVVADETLYLEIIINGRNQDRIIQVIRLENDWQISYSDLINFGLKLNIPPKDNILLSEIQGSSVDYDSEFQRLILTVPSNILPMQYLSTDYSQRSNNQSQRDTGMFINYNLVTTTGNADATLTSLWNEFHFFSEKSFFVSNGIFQSSNYEKSVRGYTRFDTYIQRDNEIDLSTTTVGDVINATPTWGRSIRIGGIRIARDYELDPALITYPLPQFYGESALPGSVELMINDQLRWRNQVTSGPFLINMAPYMSGAGVAQVITTNAQGQQVRQAVNFYVTSDLLTEGMFDYDITAGFRRKDFGITSNSYADSPIMSSSFRYGLNNYLTPQILVQTGEGLRLGGIGFTVLAGNLGVFDIASSSSHYRDTSGQQNSIAYDYSYKKFAVNARYLQRFGHYRDLAEQDGDYSVNALNDTQAQIAFSIHDNMYGSFNFGYFRMLDRQNEKHTLVNVSWNRYFAKDISTVLNFSKQLTGMRENTFNVTFSMPLGSSGQVGLSRQRDQTGEWRTQAQAMSNAPYEGGFGWGLSLDDSDQKNRYLFGDWRTRYAELSASSYHTGDQNQYTASVNGALVVMDGDIYASHFVSDSFALVDSNQSDVPVMIGHQFVGNTDKHGKLLLPDLSSYLENRISIDLMALPANASVDSVEQMIIPRRKGGVHVKFPIKFSQAVIINVLTADREPLPAGATLISRDTEDIFIAGWGGEVYIENLVEPLTLYWADGECLVIVQPAEDKSIPLPRLGPLICEPVTGVH